MTSLVMLIHLVSAGVVAYACFCRLTKTTCQTLTSVRFGLWAIASAALTSLAAPVIWDWRPDIMHAGIFAALAVSQISTRRQWQHGVPEWFQRGCHAKHH